MQHNCRQEAVNTELSGQVTTLREKVGRLKVHNNAICVFVGVHALQSQGFAEIGYRESK